MDVFSCGKIHDVVCPPLGGPLHFFHLFIDGGCYGRVADVGIDFHEEITADNHWLVFGVIDIGRNDGATTGYFRANVFRGDVRRHFGTEGLARMLVVHRIA